MQQATEPKNLVLILMRELASNVATPMFIVDAAGTLVFYNEPAEEVVGQTWAQLGEIHVVDWGKRLAPRDPHSGARVSLSDVPTALAMMKQEPAHRELTVTTADGGERTVEVTSLPLFARADEFVGAVTIFWERR